MASYNHNLRYRPLRGGVVIVADGVGEFGTLGGMATTDGNDRWLLTCRHVLARTGQPLPSDRAVYQPEPGAANAIAVTDSAFEDALLDCAAARILPNVMNSGEILGLSELSDPRAPQVGQRVMKAGRRTGVTEGRIVAIQSSKVTIEPALGYPVMYDLSERGDSGALWVDRRTGAPVVLHTSGSTSGPELAFGSSLPDVLSALNLTLIIS